MDNVEKILSQYPWPETNQTDMFFGTRVPPFDLVELARKTPKAKGVKMFRAFENDAARIVPPANYRGTWKQKALLYAISLSCSLVITEQAMEDVCGLIFQYTVDRVEQK